MSIQTAREGWAQVLNGVRWHYFRDGLKSLCKRFAAPAEHVYVNGNHNSPDNCRACQKLRARSEKVTAK